MSFFGSILRNIRRVFQPSAPSAPAPAPRAPPARANVLTRAATSRGAGSPLTSSISRSQSPAPPAAFNPSTPFGSSLPASVQKAPSAPRRSSGGGGGGSTPSPTPSAPSFSQPIAPSFSQSLGLPPSPSFAAPSGPPAATAASSVGLNLPLGSQLNASAIDKIKFGADIFPGAAFATKGATLTNAFVKDVWKRKATLQTQKALAEIGVKADQLARGEGIETLVNTALQSIRKAESQQLGKAALNSANTRRTISYLDKLVKGAKQPKVVLGLLISSLSVVGGALVFSKLMNPNARGDVSQSLKITLKEASDSQDAALFNETLQLINDTNAAMEAADGPLGDWSPFKYGKTEMLKVSNLAKEGSIMERSMDAQIQQDQDNRAYWEEVNAMQAERDQQYEQNKIEEEEREQEQQDFFLLLQQQKDEAIAAQDKRRAKEFDRRLKKERKAWEKRQADLLARDELLRTQRLAEWDAKVAEFNRQQRIYMENWTKRQKYYQEQRGSNLGFGLFR